MLPKKFEPWNGGPLDDLDVLLGNTGKAVVLPNAHTKSTSKMLADLDDLLGEPEKSKPAKGVQAECAPAGDFDAFFKEILGDAPNEVLPKLSEDKGDTEADRLDAIYKSADEILKRKLSDPIIGIASRMHIWGMTDSVPKSHDFQIGAGGTGMFPRGSLSVVASPGGMLKTALAISILEHCASGQSWAGFPVLESCGLLLALEDDKDETTRRLIATAKAQIDSTKHDLLPTRIKVAALSGFDARITAKLGGSSGITLVAQQVIQIANDAAAECGLPVGPIVVDHSRLAIGGDANDSSDVTELTRALAHIANKTGAAVLLLCHSPKSTINPKHPGEYSAADVLGSGAFVDNARFACVITTLTEKERKEYALTEETAKRHVALRIIKSNYSETGRVIYIRKTPVDGWGVVVPDVVTLSKPARVISTPTAPSDKVFAFIKSHSGRFTKTKFKEWAGTSGPMGMGVAAATVNLDALIEAGRVGLRAPTSAEVKEFSLGRQAKEVLYVPE